jgi:pSer/pThr/pTyr-binding forkhead associated (FHA) protein
MHEGTLLTAMRSAATQNALDPRRLGQQNSGFSDEDIADIVCLLYPNSENASLEVQRMAHAPEYRHHITGRYTADAIKADLEQEDSAREFGRTRGIGDHAIVLRLSSTVKRPQLGFTFGRNSNRCDICFMNDPARRLSNIHFRIYANKHGIVMLEDQSTNGTIVDDVLLKKRDHRGMTTRTLQSGSTIKIFMEQNVKDLTFIVRIPRREGELEEAYNRNLKAYLRRFQNPSEDLDRTIGPGPSGHVSGSYRQLFFAIAKRPQVNLFTPPFPRQQREDTVEEITQHAPGAERPPREWRGGEKYNRVRELGRGAFATVYLVTSKYNGLPYAAKELDKRKFMKNGVLDHKVENELKIMQAVRHVRIMLLLYEPFH